MRRFWTLALVLTLAALGLRLFVALQVASDCSGDGPIYRQIALDLLEHGEYSMETEAPFTPTLIRMPGYPLVLAGTYALFGKGSVHAIHVIQAFADTATCWVAALLCALWAPPAWLSGKRDRAVLWTFALCAACPFTLVYAGTLLTETWALLFGTSCVLAGAWALLGRDWSGPRWVLSGVLGGLACLFRPDLGLLLAALGLVLLGTGAAEALAAKRAAGTWRGAAPTVGRTVWLGLIFSLAFACVLVPWTVRNARVFGVFQPLAPPRANMPGDFVPRGYDDWVKSWIARPRDVEYFLWPLDERPMDPSGLPASACDSQEERTRVAALFDAYNRGNGSPAMTPELDAAFGAIAARRAAAHPVRQRLLLPARRAWNIWFDTHSIYYPFDGYLTPLSQLSTEWGQVVLLPLLYLLVWIYTALGLAGVVVWSRAPACGRWIALLALLFLPRILFLSSLENPEPRYMVELFPFVSAAGGLALAAGGWRAWSSSLAPMARRAPA